MVEQHRQLSFSRPMPAGVNVSNPNLAQLEGDFLYHLGLTAPTPGDDAASAELTETFGDVQFFCCGGSAGRMTEFAQTLADNFAGTQWELPYGSSPNPIGKQDRYSIFKVGPVLVSSHGMGQPSISIMLHEITKLLNYAQAQDVVYFRLGSSGGIGVEPGTVVVTTQGVNGMVQPVYSLPILGKMVDRPALIDASLVEAVTAAAVARGLEMPVVPGKTMSTDCFYEGQGRLDGALCEYNNDDKLAFLHRLHDDGVRNIEMEAAMFASFTHRLGIRGTGLCATLLNRLEGDQVLTPLEDLAEFDSRPGKVAIAYINEQLGI